MKNFPENWLQSPHMAEVKLVYQTKGQLPSQPALCTPEEACQYLLSIWDHDTLELYEEFAIVLLNSSLKVLGWYKVSSGGKNATVVDISHVVCAAVLSNAHSVLLAHNHPSNTAKPSSADINLTRRISEALKNIGILISDHIILTSDGYYSFKEHNLL